MYSVLIADDHAFSSKGLAQSLQNHGSFKVLKSVDNGLDAITQTKVQTPDLAVFDMVMPGVSGLEAMIEGMRWSRTTKFVILTGGAPAEQLTAVLDAGACGLFIKTSSPEDICDGLVRIAKGERVITKEAVALMASADAVALTPRETEVLRAIARGWSNSVTADHLGLSAKTVDSHRTSLMRKLNVNSSASLIVRAVRDGLIDVNSLI